MPVAVAGAAIDRHMNENSDTLPDMLAILEEDTWAFWEDFAHRPEGAWGRDSQATSRVSWTPENQGCSAATSLAQRPASAVSSPQSPRVRGIGGVNDRIHIVDEQHIRGARESLVDLPAAQQE